MLYFRPAFWYGVYASPPAGEGAGVRILRKSWLGIVLCFCVAMLLSLLLHNDEDIRLVAPLICLFAVIASSSWWGRTAAILGGIAATLTFSTCLFPPFGSIQVSDPGERTILIVFQLNALAMAFVFTPRLSNNKLESGRLRSEATRSQTGSCDGEEKNCP